MKRPGAACFAIAAARRRGTENPRAQARPRAALRSACGACSLSCAAVAARSAHKVTLARAPASAIIACTGPIGSTSSEKRARQIARLRVGFGGAAVAAHLELRDRGPLRRCERHLEIPALHSFRARLAGLIGQRGDLQQRLPRERAVGLGDQLVGDLVRRGVRGDRRRGDRLRGERRAAIGRRDGIRCLSRRCVRRIASRQRGRERLGEVTCLLGRERRALRQLVRKPCERVRDMPDGFEV